MLKIAVFKKLKLAQVRNHILSIQDWVNIAQQDGQSDKTR